MAGEQEATKSFWSGLGGTLTGIAAIITAIATLLTVLDKKNRPVTPPAPSPQIEKSEPIRPAEPKKPAEMTAGMYRLSSINGIAQYGTEMRLTRRDGHQFTAHSTVTNGLFYDSELIHLNGASWSIRITGTNDNSAPRFAVANEITFEGSRLTFASQFGHFVWEWTGP